MMSSIEKYIKEGDTLICSSESSKAGTSFFKLMGEHGPGMAGLLRERLPVAHRMIGCALASRKSRSSVTNNPRLGKVSISDDELCELETFVKSLGVDQIGYTVVPRELIFRGHKILYSNAIVITMQMMTDKIAIAPSKPALGEIFRTYHKLGLTVNKIAEYLRSRGFNAMAAPAIGGDVNYVPLAEKAGLGAMGRHGLLITDKSYGPSLRIAAVYTDIENLPFATENNHLWIKKFCKKCGKCVKSCPAGAIRTEMSPYGQCIDQAKCAQPFANNYGCTVCIKSCTFFNNPMIYQKLKTIYNK